MLMCMVFSALCIRLCIALCSHLRRINLNRMLELLRKSRSVKLEPPPHACRENSMSYSNYYCPRLKRGLQCHWCTPEWVMCHHAMKDKCFRGRCSYCERGWHITQKQYEEEYHTSKRTLPSRYADDSSVNKRPRSKTTTEAAKEKKKWPVHQRKWLDLHIYLIRLGFYNIPHDETLPHPIEIENAYRNAMEEELPQEEKQRKDEAFEQIMRAINGHDLDQECESED